MKVKTTVLTKKALDWALAKALGSKHITHDALGVYADDRDFPIKRNVFGCVNHTDPATCLWLIEQHKIDVTWGTSGKAFVQMSGGNDSKWHSGKTLTEAVARCVVAMVSGDEVEVPDELRGGDS